jgi:hypothetical protein
MANWTKGYESSTPESATAPKATTGDKYMPIGQSAIETKRKWKDAPIPDTDTEESNED